MRTKIFYGWWVVLASMGISLYVGAVVEFGFTAFFEPIRSEFGWSYTQVSAAASLRGIEMGLLAPVIGFLVGRFGARAMVQMGVVVIGCGLIVLSRTQTLLGFYLAFGLMGLGAGGCASMVTMTAVANWFRRRLGTALGIMSCGFGASGLLVPAIVAMIDRFGWRGTCLILGIGMWVVGMPLAWVIRNDPLAYGDFPDGDPQAEPTGVEADVDGAEHWPIGKILRQRSFVLTNVAEALRVLVVLAIATHIMPYLTRQGVPALTAGGIAGAIPLLSIIGRFGFGWLADRYEKRLVFVCCYLGMAVGLLAFAGGTHWALLGVFLVVFSPCYGGGFVLRGALLRVYFGKAAFAKLLGITYGVAAFGGLIGPVLTGWIVDRYGGYQWVWGLFAAILIFAALLMLQVRPLVENPE